MRIIVNVIPHHLQRYPTCGDYAVHHDQTNVWVSKMGNEDYEWLVAIHELIEQKLTSKAGITNEQIDAFDMGAGADLDDPGASDAAPYHHEHMIATSVEMMLCSLLGLSWADYEKAIKAL